MWCYLLFWSPLDVKTCSISPRNYKVHVNADYFSSFHDHIYLKSYLCLSLFLRDNIFSPYHFFLRKSSHETICHFLYNMIFGTVSKETKHKGTKNHRRFTLLSLPHLFDPKQLIAPQIFHSWYLPAQNWY